MAHDVLNGTTWDTDEQRPTHGRGLHSSKSTARLQMRILIALLSACRAWGSLLLRSPRQARHARRWFSSIRAQQRHGVQLWDLYPWLVFDAQEYLEELIGKDTKVFEWGSGISTLWLARRAGTVVSVEYDPEWHAAVGAALAERGLRNCEQMLFELDADATEAEHEAYASAIDGFDDEHFDLVIIDGRARVRCAANAVAKVAPGGLLLLDNAERPRYRDIFERLTAWDRTDFFGPGPYLRSFWQTQIWRRVNPPRTLRSEQP